VSLIKLHEDIEHVSYCYDSLKYNYQQHSLMSPLKKRWHHGNKFS